MILLARTGARVGVRAGAAGPATNARAGRVTFAGLAAGLAAVERTGRAARVIGWYREKVDVILRKGAEYLLVVTACLFDGLRLVALMIG